jgi:PEP-CTERM/exosortase A-associated glycosyltransferase
LTHILHVLDHSLPEQSGYSYRSHAILRALGAHGVDVAVVTGPKHVMPGPPVEEIDGVRYQRTPSAAGGDTSGVLGQIRTVLGTRRRIASYLRERSTQILHAHSPCLNGIAALGHGVPLLYEMRSSWEDAAVSVGTTTEGSPRYRASRMLETLVARRADEVVVICEGLRSDLIARGVSPAKIAVVPNALPEEMFDLASQDQAAAVRQKHGLEHARIVGFFGSFFEWEGIGALIQALPMVIESIPEARLLLAGGGRDESRLRQLVGALGLEDRVVFAGRIPHDAVRAYYRAADVVAYPRVSDRLTEMVTPLKPLEAMAQKTPVVASNVGGHRELIADGETGFLYQSGSVPALAVALREVLGAPERAARVVATARSVVERERRWSKVCERYLPIYDRLSGRTGHRVADSRRPTQAR